MDMKSYYALIGISSHLWWFLLLIYLEAFQGYNMTPSGTSQILEQIGRVVMELD